MCISNFAIDKNHKLNRKMMKNKEVLTLIIAAMSLSLSAQGQEVKSDTTLIATPSNKEVKNRNVMLNAGDSSTPRTLNIGLPFSGDILINENGIPVVYTFWTQIPTTVWRYDSSFGRMGVMSFAEGALTFGKVGNVVNSYDREPGRKMRIFANFRTSSEGNLNYDANLTSPIGKNGWGISLSAHETYNRGSIKNYQFSTYSDRTEIFKGGIFKKYQNGKFSLLYKYAKSKPVTGGYAPYIYRGNGKTEPYGNFKPGKDSYIVGTGLFPYTDWETGNTYFANLEADSVTANISHAMYFNAEHRFKNKMKLTFDAMYMTSKVALTMQYPVSLSIYDDANSAIQNSGLDRFGQGGYISYYNSNGKRYEGPVQMVSAQYYPQVRINQFLAKAEIVKKYNSHNLRLGSTYMYYNAPVKTNRGTYLQSVEPNPQLLEAHVNLPSEMGGGSVSLGPNINGNGSYSKTRYSRFAIYFSDDFELTNWLSGGIGARIETENDKDTHYPYTNTTHNVHKANCVTHNFNGFNYVWTTNWMAKVTRHFGFVAEATYNRYMKNFWDYAEKDENGSAITTSRNDQPQEHYESVLNLGGGVYWNIGQYLNLVSKVTYITKNDIVASEDYYDASGSQRSIYPILYDIKTLGWTTDLMSTFGNFNLHFLFTIQDPKYKNYSYSVPASTEGGAPKVFGYNNMNIPALSKILIEIDPSYYFFNRNLRVWASARYFGKQYGNKPNTISYNGWWETFCGMDYKLNRYVDLKLQVNNVLNQTGVSGALVGGDQIMDEKAMIGRGFVAGNIRPRCVELSASFKF